MPKTPAEANIKLVMLTTKPADWRKPKIAELNAGIDISTKILKSDYKFGPTASDTINEAALSAAGNSKDFGASNFDASITPWRYHDGTGKVALTEDAVYQALKVKGTEVYMYERRGAHHTQAFAAGDIVTGAWLTTDNPTPVNDLSGYLKSTIALGHRDFVLDVAVTA